MLQIKWGTGVERNHPQQIVQKVKEEFTVFRNEEIFDDVTPLYKNSECISQITVC